MKCKLADKAFYMAIEKKILSKDDNELKELIRFYAYEKLDAREKFTLALMISEIEKAIKGNKNG